MPPFAGWDRSIDLPLVLLLGYLAALWAGGWALEVAARAHFRKAQGFAHEGFDYDSLHDRYECPQGELLTLQTFDDRDKLAIYKAPAPTCNACVLKAFCTPHDEGRRVYRSLAEFHETDVGLFHRRLSLLILAIASLFALGGMVAWWGRPGEPFLLVALIISVLLLWRDLFGETRAGGDAGGPARIGPR
ncbi:hypothetical protein TA3x_000587 [Tundrisphaera sp. TA3]|uniref:hypothetical protein n=1 Tax=Tundrisphaera sp. TA3 TaxID=3435775 RepID=UPI003EBBDF91